MEIIYRDWSGTNADGLTTYCTQQINVVDTDVPRWPTTTTKPADVTVQCASDIPAGKPITTNDRCDGNFVTYPTDEIVKGDCAQQFKVIRTWKFTDKAGNSRSWVQIITVNDTKAPVLTVPADVNGLACAAGTDPSVTGMATATDNCGTAKVSYTDVTSSGSASCSVITRTWTATDDCGNSTQKVQKISVTDEQAPTFVNCPADLTVNGAAEVPAVPTDVMAIDDCDTDVVVEYLGEETVEGTCGPDGYTLVRTWMATDDCGNFSYCEQKITVRKPELTNECYSLKPARNYDAARNTTTFTYELCLIGDKCKDISNIRFSIPCGLPKSDLLSASATLPGLNVEINGRTGQCERYDVQFDGFRDGVMKQSAYRCITFTYVIKGDLTDYQTNVAIKAGTQTGLDFTDVFGGDCGESATGTETAPETFNPAPGWSNGNGRGRGKLTTGDAERNEVALFPNPVSSQVTLRFYAADAERVSVQVFDATGRSQVSRLVDATAGSNQLEIGLAELPAGVYRIALQRADGSRTFRNFVKL